MSGTLALALPFLRALGLTLAVELPLSLAFFHRPARAVPRALVTVFLMNVITNPTLNIMLAVVSRYFGYAAYIAAAVAGELAVFVAEAVMMRCDLDVTRRRALAASLTLNAASVAAGFILK